MHLQTLKEKLRRDLQELRQQWTDAIHVDNLERRWVAICLLSIGFMVCVITLDALIHGTPPSQVETIDSASLHLKGSEFAEENLGVKVEGDKIMVRMVAGRYAFFPKTIEVPADTELTFRWVSMDVLHGVHSPMSNMSTMIVPGYVAQVTTQFPTPGDYPMLCNEYCGLGHNHMWGTIKVLSKDEWNKKISLTGGEK